MPGAVTEGEEPEGEDIELDGDLDDADFDAFFAEGEAADPLPALEDEDAGDVALADKGAKDDAGEGDKDANAEKDAKSEGDPPKDKQPSGERDYKREYENVQAALRESREQAKRNEERLERAFQAMAARIGKADGEGGGGEKKPEHVGPPEITTKLKDKYADPLEEMADLRKLAGEMAAQTKWFADQYKGNIQSRAEADKRTEEQRKADDERVRFFNDVKSKVEEFVPEEQRGDFGDAFRHVLNHNAEVLLESPSARQAARYYHEQGLSGDDLRVQVERWAVQQANEGLHYQAAQALRAGKNPVEALFARAKHLHFQTKAERSAAKEAAERAEAEKKAAAKEAAQKDAAKREKGKTALSTTLGKTGKPGGPAVQSLKDLADAMDTMEGDEFDAYMDKYTGLER